MNTYAIIEVGGEQIQVEPGRFYHIRHLGSYQSDVQTQNTKFLLYRVMLIQHKSTIVLGTPWIKNAIIKGRILDTCREKKSVIYKMNPKKKTRKKSGHRQEFARVLIDGIFLSGQELSFS